MQLVPELNPFMGREVHIYMSEDYMSEDFSVKLYTFP